MRGKNAMRKKGVNESMIAAVIAMIVAVSYCFCLFAASFHTERGASVIESLSVGMEMDYERHLFDLSSVHRLDISIGEKTWQSLKDNALMKSLYDCDLTIDGETVHHVGVRAKGNSTLLQSVISGTDRMGLVFEFDAFQEGQSYDGLDMLSLYNNSCDSSCLRDVLAYTLMREMGVPTPLCSFAAVYLNGEYLGLYIAMEGVREAFARRNFGADHGMLYKPEPSDVAGLLTGTAVGVRIDLGSLLSEAEEPGNAFYTFEKLVDVSSLQYFGEDPREYEVIWANSVFKIDRSDKLRLIQALGRLSESETAGSTVALRQVAAYSAVNTFLLNTDCYATNMGHNYYLYEKDGILSMVPWDYDQCLGISMLKNNASEDMTGLFNLAIDTPVVQTTVEERPMLACILNNEAGYEEYRAALERLMSQYLESGWIDEKVDAWAAMIKDYVAEDPMIGSDLQRHQDSLQSIRDFTAIRVRSIRGQLEGMIPSTTKEQEAHPELLVDASAYSCPDGSLINGLFLPEGEGLGLEDLLRVFNDQTSVYAVLKLLSFDWKDVRTILTLLTGQDETSAPLPAVPSETADSDGDGFGPASLISIRDEGEFTRQCIRLLWLTLRNIILPLLAVIALTVSLLLLKRVDKKREPSAVKRRRQRLWDRP